GERSLHYAMRAPTFLKLQAAVGVGDIMKELGFDFSKLSVSPIGAAHQIQGMMGQTSALLTESRETLGELRPLVAELNRIVQYLNGLDMNRIRLLAIGLVFGILVLGAALLIFAGFVFVFSKLAYERLSAKRRIETESAGGRKAA